MAFLASQTSACPEPWASLLLLPPRVAVGAGIAIGFGLPKVAHFAPYLDEVRQSGVPMPMVFAMGLMVVELIAGAALAVGLATRVAAILLTSAMAGILLLAPHASLPWDVIAFLLGGYVYVVLGGGRFSIDHTLVRTRRVGGLRHE